MVPAPFHYIASATLDDAIGALASHGEEAMLLAGGHSLIPMMKYRLARPKILIDLNNITGLKGIRQDGDKIIIGALTTHYQIESSTLLKEKCPLLPETARVIGDVQVRNRGTIGGSLAHADPAADLPAAILALGGRLSMVGPKGERRVEAEKFFLEPMATVLNSTEILTEIHIPILPKGSRTAYLKVPQKASGFAIVGVAVWLKMQDNGTLDDIGVGITGLDAKPFRAKGVEEYLKGKRIDDGLIDEASSCVTKDLDPLEDIHASAEFRAHLARVHTAKAIHKAATMVGSDDG